MLDDIANIANGIITGITPDKLVTGFGIFSGAASIASYVSGFSVNKDINTIKKSLKTIEEIKHDLQYYSNEETKLLNVINNNIDIFSTNNIGSQINVLNTIIKLHHQQNNLLKRQQEIILESINEMKKIISSTQFNIGEPIRIKSHFTDDLIKDPFGMGVHEFALFDYNIFNRNDNFVTQNTSPIIWNDTNGNKLYGKINKNVIRNYGFDIETGMYTARYEGYKYSSRYGMYLPNIIAKK